jgi:integrase
MVFISLYRRGNQNQRAENVRAGEHAGFNQSGQKRACEMRGHLVKRGKIWSIVLELGTDENGKRRQKWIAFQGNKAEAQAELTRLIHEANSGMHVAGATMTLHAYLDRWLEDYARNSVTPKTFERYFEHVRNHIKPRLGHIQLAKLTPLHIQGFYQQCRTEGRLNGKGGLSERTVLHLHSVLHSALKQAVRWQLIPRNPVDAVARPKPQPAEMHYLSEDEAVALIATSKETPYGTIVELALASGARRGEILALKWTDFDFASKSMSINRSLEQTRGGVLRFKPPKTKKSRRRIDLSEGIIQTLLSHKAEQTRRRLLLGAAYQGGDLVFCTGDGSPLRPDSISVWFKKLVARFGRPEVRFHDLRHTHATILLSHNVHPKIVSERLGHSSIAITMDTYSHVLPTMQEDAARAIGAALGMRAG